MTLKEKTKKFYYKKNLRMIAGITAVIFVLTIALQSATTVAIYRNADKTAAATNYLAENTEYANKNRPQRVIDYLDTLGPKQTLEDYYKSASIHIARAEYADALDNIEKCIALYNNEGSDIYHDLLSKRGCLQVMLGRYDAALQSLDLALKQDPTAANLYLVKAQIFAEQKDMDKLAESLNAYLQLVPGDTAIRALLAQAKFSEGDYDAAVQQYREILSTNPNAETEYLYGLNAVRDSDFATAEEHLSQAIAKDDSYNGIYYYRGVSRMSLGNYPGAIKDLTVSIEREDMLQASYYTRGVCRLMNEEHEQGLADLQIAAAGSDDEEVTQQARQLLAELEDAQAEAERQAAQATISKEAASEAVKSLSPDINIPAENDHHRDEDANRNN